MKSPSSRQGGERREERNAEPGLDGSPYVHFPLHFAETAFFRASVET